MRICLVHRDIHHVGRGGICTLYRALADRLATRGHQVVLLTQETPHPLQDSRLQVVTMPRTEDLAAHRRAVTDELVQIAPDVVESSTWEAETLDYIDLPRHERAPLLVRGDLSARTMGAHELGAAERDLLRRADHVVAVSHFAARDLAAS